MRKKVLIRGPVLSQSGYGEHARFVARALRTREDEYDIHILPTGWGETGWLAINDDERRWIDERVNECSKHIQSNKSYDISVQVTIPNEWQRMAPVNVGVTAGIECNKVSPVWIEKANEMDKIITVSEHSKNGFVRPIFTGRDPQTGATSQIRCDTPVEVIHYPVKKYDELSELDIDLEYDFNYIAVAQWGPRKNIQNLIRWFVEENVDQPVGLVIKTSLKNNSVVDREYAEDMIRSNIPDIDDRKCKIYILHGDLSSEEMHSLYQHPKIKAMVSLTHGEGYGLPLFEAAYSGLPVIAPGWSGQNDFLYAPKDAPKKKKKTKKAMFAEVDYTLGPIPDFAFWEGVIERDTIWAYPTEGSFKLRLRQVRKNYDKWLKKAKSLQTWVQEEFEWDKKHLELVESISSTWSENSQHLMSDSAVDSMFEEMMSGR